MLSLNLTKYSFEDFPDEILLIICGYLSSIEVLYSFYGLNHRLTQLISGYFRHIVLGQSSYKQFRFLCSSILPQLSFHITSLVVSNQWKGILSKIFLNLTNETFYPNLKSLTCISFSDQSLKIFLNSMKNLENFHQLNLCHLYQLNTESECFLDEIFTANNHRLNTILFDDDSIIFSLKNQNLNKIYSNIQKLSIDLKTIDDLHKLLTILPQLISLDVVINKDTSKIDMNNSIEPVMNLKSFQLQSFGPIWKFHELITILKRLQSIEQLAIAIETNADNNNQQFLNGQDFLLFLSKFSLKKFDYFLRYYDSSNTIDPNKILLTWQTYDREFVCFQSDDKQTLVLYTVPFVFSFLILPNSIAKHEIFLKHYTPRVKSLTLSNHSTSMTELFYIIKKCRQIENLHLRISEHSITNFPKETNVYKLSHLTKFAALRDSTIHSDDYISKLFEISPNLYHLEVNYEFLKSFLNNQSICSLFKSRISHMYLLVPISTDCQMFLSSISNFLSIFSSLKHFYICFEKLFDLSEYLILTILNYLFESTNLISFGLVGIRLIQYSSKENLQQWILENLTIDQEKSFVVDYTEHTFRLWL